MAEQLYNATQAAHLANEWRYIASGGRAATISLPAICNWTARGHLTPTGLDEHGRKLYRLADVARAEKATRERALRLVGIGTPTPDHSYASRDQGPAAREHPAL